MVLLAGRNLFYSEAASLAPRGELTELLSMATRMVLPGAAASESPGDLVVSVETALGGIARREGTLLHGSSTWGMCCC